VTPPHGIDSEAVLARLADDEREVRHAAVEAVGRLGIQAAVPALLEQRESSWLLRFAVLDALSTLGATAALAERLRREMSSLQERNPIFGSGKDPLIELEYPHCSKSACWPSPAPATVAACWTSEGTTWEFVDDEDDV